VVQFFERKSFDPFRRTISYSQFGFSTLAELRSRARVSGAPNHANAVKKKMNTSVIQNEEPAWKTSAPEAFSGAAEPKKRILIVENDKAGARTLAIQVESGGYEAMTHDAANAAAAAKKTPPDLLIVDISMLGEGGFGVAERIQQSVLWCVPTIFLTADKEPGLRKKAEDFEAAGFFEGQYEPAELMAAVNLALREEDAAQEVEM
jgi:CheY-like chemotaxis protein